VISESATIAPLAPGRFKIQFTASADLRDKLERLEALLCSSQEDASIAAVIEAAVSEKLQRLEAKRFGLAVRPRKTVGESDTSPHSRHIPAAVRRSVWKRDQGRCGFVDCAGRRCAARKGLQFHHRHPFGMGGDHAVANLALRCVLHNQHIAEKDYGRNRMADAQRRALSSLVGPDS
jgi:hypothetical protein